MLHGAGIFTYIWPSIPEKFIPQPGPQKKPISTSATTFRTAEALAFAACVSFLYRQIRGLNLI